jgi:hypothetical protein
MPGVAFAFPQDDRTGAVLDGDIPGAHGEEKLANGRVRAKARVRSAKGTDERILGEAEEGELISRVMFKLWIEVKAKGARLKWPGSSSMDGRMPL